MARTPFSILPEEPEMFENDRYGGSVILDDTNQMPSAGDMPSAPHLSLVGALLLLIGLKYASDANFITTDVRTFRYSALDTIGTGLQAFVFIVLAKVFFFKLAATAPDFPGVKDGVNLFSFI